MTCAPLGLLALLGACALQPPAHTPLPALPERWSHGGSGSTLPAGTDPWRALHDPAIPALIAQAERTAPTLAQAAARIALARATLGTATAVSRPQLGASLAASRDANTSSLPVIVESTGTAGLSASWEIDLFGRLRHGRAAARLRLDARDADARLARLSLEAQIADGVIQRRACALVLDRQRATLASAQTTLRLTELKRDSGLASPLDVARSQSSVGDNAVAVESSVGECAQDTQVLAFLSGLDAPGVEQLLADTASLPADALPAPPPFEPGLPASVLAGHPSLLSAQREADAAFEEIGAARAGRLPSLDLASLLSVSRIAADGLDATVHGWSIAPTLAVAAYDGGAGAANVSAARSRYALAVAQLDEVLRETVRDVELALIQGAAASRGARSAAGAVAAAEDLFRASEAAQRAGRLSVFDLEIARATLLSAQSNLIHAERDRARAWIALVKATATGVAEPVHP